MEKDRHVIRRDVLRADGELARSKFFDEVEMMLEERDGFLFEAFDVNRPFEHERRTVFVENTLGAFREELATLALREIVVDAFEYSRPKAKCTRRLVAVIEHYDAAEQTLLDADV